MGRAWRRPEEDKDFLGSDTSSASSNSGHEGSIKRKTTEFKWGTRMDEAQWAEPHFYYRIGPK